jgi:hypothetical protein
MLLTRHAGVCAAPVVARATATRPTVIAAAPLRARVGQRGVAVGLRAGSHLRSVCRRGVVVAASADAASPPTPKRTDRIHWSTAFATGVVIAAAASPLVRSPSGIPDCERPARHVHYLERTPVEDHITRLLPPLRGCRTLVLATRTLCG